MDNCNMQSKNVSLAMNGVPDSPFISTNFISLEDIKRRAQQVFNQKFEHIRLFTPEGVEMFSEDLKFLKNGTLLYVSDHQDFDQSSSFSVYQIVKFLGEGGFGKVLLGKHKITNEFVAIKIIDTYKIGNAVDIDMVFREAELMKSLRHTGIVKIHNCYTLPNMQVVIVMEYLQGGELLAYLEEHGRLSEDEARYYFKQIAEAMSYCHNQNLIHRDLKLENILLTSKFERKVKIVDFGIAGLATNFNVDKLDVGSLSYMAPEVLSGRAKRLGPSIDIWALGVILYALVCGTLPFTKNNQQMTLNAIIEGTFTYPYIPISTILKDLLSKMLNTDESHRIRMYELLNHPWVVQQVDLQKLLSNPQYLLPGKKSFGRETTKVTFGGQKHGLLSNIGKREFTSTKGLMNMRSGTTQMKFNGFKKPAQNPIQEAPPISVKLIIPPTPRKMDESVLPSSRDPPRSSRKIDSVQFDLLKPDALQNELSDSNEKSSVQVSEGSRKQSDVQLGNKKKSTDLSIKIINPDKEENDSLGETDIRFITKDYEEVVEKYKHLKLPKNIKLNPFQRELEQYEKEKKRKKERSLPQSASQEMSPKTIKISMTLKSMIHSTFTSPSRPQTQAVKSKSSLFRSHKSNLSLTNHQFKWKHTFKSQQFNNLIQSPLQSQEHSPTCKNEKATRYLDERKTENKFYIKSNWEEKYKLSPSVKYQLQQNFMERKKNKEEVFYQTFRSFLNQHKKPTF